MLISQHCIKKSGQSIKYDCYKTNQGFFCWINKISKMNHLKLRIHYVPIENLRFLLEQILAECHTQFHCLTTITSACDGISSCCYVLRRLYITTVDRIVSSSKLNAQQYYGALKIAPCSSTMLVIPSDWLQAMEWWTWKIWRELHYTTMDWKKLLCQDWMGYYILGYLMLRFITIRIVNTLRLV